MKYIYLIFAVFVFVFVVPCTFGQGNIRSIDFKNFTYLPMCTDMEEGKNMEKITVKNGEFSREKQMDGYVDHFSFNILGVEYGDLNGDKQDEAVVNTVCNTGGTGDFSEGFIFTMRGGKPVLLARVPGGDRADGGLRSLTVENGRLVVDANEDKSTGACCPEYAIKTEYRLVGTKLSEVGKGVERALYPSERFMFDRGTSSKTFTIRVNPDDRKRYVLGARAGQTLTVTMNTGDNLSASLLGDTVTTDAGNGFAAKLPKNGDYTFEISNYGQTATDVTVTVTIK